MAIHQPSYRSLDLQNSSRARLKVDFSMKAIISCISGQSSCVTKNDAIGCRYWFPSIQTVCNCCSHCIVGFERNPNGGCWKEVVLLHSCNEGKNGSGTASSSLYQFFSAWLPPIGNHLQVEEDYCQVCASLEIYLWGGFHDLMVFHFVITLVVAGRCLRMSWSASKQSFN